MKNVRTGLYEYRCAYRYPTGEIDGFLGISIQGEAAARQDAIGQIGRRLIHVNHVRKLKKLDPEEFEPGRVITDPITLSVADRALVEADWHISMKIFQVVAKGTDDDGHFKKGDKQS